MMSEKDRLVAIHKTLISFNKRAERSSNDLLVATFVDSEPLFDLLSTTNNQVIYGRRGTGKTHALRFLAEKVAKDGHLPVYLDLRSIGSNGSIYGDPSKSLSERASTLIIDVLKGLSDELYQVAVSQIDQVTNPEQITLRVDDLAASISTVEISGSVESQDQESQVRKDAAGLRGTVSKQPSLAVELNTASDSTLARSTRRSGKERVRINFGSVATALSGLLKVLGGQRVWLLIDEWSEVPHDLQPYLADLLRRSVLPVGEITVKIAAIEHRSNFAILEGRGEYTGIELGADVSADLHP